MDNVVDIDSLKPHWAGDATCSACGHLWIAAAPVGTRLLECPSCKHLAGVPFSPRELAMIRALEEVATGRAPHEPASVNLSIARSIAADALLAAGWPVKK